MYMSAISRFHTCFHTCFSRFLFCVETSFIEIYFECQLRRIGSWTDVVGKLKNVDRPPPKNNSWLMDQLVVLII